MAAVLAHFNCNLLYYKILLQMRVLHCFLAAEFVSINYAGGRRVRSPHSVRPGHGPVW